MEYQPKDFSGLYGMEGFSDELLQNHFTLYEGYVANTNKALELMLSLPAGTPEYAEVHRRFGWEFNGMRLHELYFEHLTPGGKKCKKDSTLWGQMDAAFGTKKDAWKEDFRAVASMRGIGWVVTYRDGDRLVNTWINEHDAGHLAGATPIIVLDAFEHAFLTDYGLNKAEYVDAFLKNLDWSVVEKR